MKKLVLSAAMLMVSSPAFAYCDLERLPFGSGIIKIAEKYNVNNDPVMAKATGANMLLANGNRVCSDLAEKVVVRMDFINDKLTQVMFEDKNSDGSVLDLAKKNFGEPSQKKNPSHPDAANLVSVWSDDLPVSVMFSSKMRGKKLHERLELSGKKFQKNMRSEFKKNEKNK
jgi:hypothetical protein